jgi:hypothetical protein
MKKIILSLCCFALSIISILAQNEIGSITYGVKLGGTSSWLSGANAPEELSETGSFGYSYENKLKNHLSISGGVYVDYIFSEKLNFRGELLYTTKGYNETTTVIQSNKEKSVTESKTPIRYLEIPLLITYSFDIHDEKYKPYFLGGFVPSYMLSVPTLTGTQTNYDPSGKVTSTKTGEQTAPSDQIRRLDFGLALGVGTILKNGLGIEFRYTSGLNTIATNGETNNKHLALSVSYRLK